MKQHGGMTTLALRQQLAAKAYARTAAYDAAITNWFAASERDVPDIAASAASSSRHCATARIRTNRPRFYAHREARSGVATARQIQGKELSYNNINDTDAAYELVAEFDPAPAACAIIKHANPCGVAVGSDLARRLHARRWPAIRSRAFGGIIALNRPLDAEAARRDRRNFHRSDHRARRRR